MERCCKGGSWRGREGVRKGVREGGREGVREGVRKGGREGVRKGVREGGSGGVREGVRKGGREGVREGGSEGGRKGSSGGVRGGIICRLSYCQSIKVRTNPKSCFTIPRNLPTVSEEGSFFVTGSRDPPEPKLRFLKVMDTRLAAMLSPVSGGCGRRIDFGLESELVDAFGGCVRVG